MTLKCNAVVVSGLGGLFYWSYMFAKHDQALRDVIPFGNDPYDAVGSFGVLVGILLALLSFVRAFWPYRLRLPTAVQRVYLVRSQEAVVLVVLVTLASDVIAMARHPKWYTGPSRSLLIGLLGSLALVAVGVHLLVREGRQKPPKFGSDGRLHAGVAVFVALSTLAVYPEHLINSTATHLLTVVVGATVLFAPIRPLLVALVPYDGSDVRTATAPAHKLLSPLFRWGIVLLLGAFIGCFVFVGEMNEGNGTLPVGRTIFVASIFIGLATAGLLIAYAFLGGPLGLSSRTVSESGGSTHKFR
jgi:hypothetical protein